ncbi:AAA family ATPase [Rhodococcus sp. HNM0563]|uniref:AAA family ATPase n=1 Tax=Rhodococcus sp. HNM0563 TaxID=2716339 RepID=UPI00146EAFEF|nr:AAA family ATPase [Rhodococcus sp. HNM0563]NLU64258.1 AAA family ATPase [Rhodococcus sp. HNM0563]
MGSTVQDVRIPERFSYAIDQHLVFNYTGVQAWPLVLGIFGRPGDGKSFQVRTHLECRGILPVSINAADLESDRAGMPGKLVLDTYEDAGHRIDEGNPTVLVVDDFDTTVGEWAQSTTTVNHQQVLAQLMHLADSPTRAGDRSLRRVPVIITGNDLSKVYPPLRRPGRMRAFPWLPTTEERAHIVTGILGSMLSPTEINELLGELEEAPIAFFSDLLVEVLAESSDAAVRRHAASLPRLILPRSTERQELERVLPTGRLDGAQVKTLALHVWHQRMLATQSYVGE